MHQKSYALEDKQREKCRDLPSTHLEHGRTRKLEKEGIENASHKVAEIFGCTTKK